MTKYLILLQANQDQIKLIAYQSCRGPVSDFIQRPLQNNANNMWDQLKAKLTNWFSEVTDPQHSLRLLHDVKQGKQEIVQIYAKRLGRGRLCWATVPSCSCWETADTVNFFIDGLVHEYLYSYIFPVQANDRHEESVEVWPRRSNNTSRQNSVNAIQHEECTKRCWHCCEAGYLRA